MIDIIMNNRLHNMFKKYTIIKYNDEIYLVHEYGEDYINKTIFNQHGFRLKNTNINNYEILFEFDTPIIVMYGEYYTIYDIYGKNLFTDASSKYSNSNIKCNNLILNYYRNKLRIKKLKTLV